MRPFQVLVCGVLVIVAFLVGAGLGAMDDPSEVPPTVEYVEVLSGDFEDVPLSMSSGTGNTYRWVCDMHFTPAPDDGHSAECEYQDP